jgi:hypothetical protein
MRASTALGLFCLAIPFAVPLPTAIKEEMVKNGGHLNQGHNLSNETQINSTHKLHAELPTELSLGSSSGFRKGVLAELNPGSPHDLSPKLPTELRTDIATNDTYELKQEKSNQKKVHKKPQQVDAEHEHHPDDENLSPAPPLESHHCLTDRIATKIASTWLYFSINLNKRLALDTLTEGFTFFSDSDNIAGNGPNGVSSKSLVWGTSRI